MNSLKLNLKISRIFTLTLLASFCGFCSDNAYGIDYMLHANSVLELQIAKDGPTRINIEREKINDIFIHPKEAAEVAIHDSGSVFILPQQDKNKVYLSIVGENGTTQDLALNFTKTKPNPIRLMKFSLEDEAMRSQISKENNCKHKECKKYKLKKEAKD